MKCTRRTEYFQQRKQLIELRHTKTHDILGSSPHHTVLNCTSTGGVLTLV